LFFDKTTVSIKARFSLSSFHKSESPDFGDVVAPIFALFMNSFQLRIQLAILNWAKYVKT